MGFIKAIETATVGQINDMYREVIRYENKDKGVLVQKVTTENGIIQNESRLFVEPGQCVIYTDNGAIKDIITEPGMYFMDTSAPSLFQANIFKGLTETVIQGIKRIAYEGKEITTQAVYFINLAEVTDLKFGTPESILYEDPEWGPMEIFAHGSYGVKVSNPVNLLVNVNSNDDTCTYSEIGVSVQNYIISNLMKKINTLKVPFTQISANLLEISGNVIEEANKELDTLGVELTRVVISNISVPDEIKNAMKERTSIKMKASSVNNEEADIYTKLNTAEAIKDLANNENNSGTSIMGMNFGNTVAGMINNNVNNKDN